MNAPESLRVITDAAFNKELKQAGGGIVFSSWDKIVKRVFTIDLKHYNLENSEHAEMITACIAMNLADAGSIRFLTNDAKRAIEKLDKIRSGRKPKRMDNALYKYMRESIERHPDIVFVHRTRDRRMMVMADSLSRVGMYSKDKSPITEFHPSALDSDHPALPSPDIFKD